MKNLKKLLFIGVTFIMGSTMNLNASPVNQNNVNNEQYRSVDTSYKTQTLDQLLDTQNINIDNTRYYDAGMEKQVFLKLNSLHMNLNSLSKIQLQKYLNNYYFNLSTEQKHQKVQYINAHILGKRAMESYEGSKYYSFNWHKNGLGWWYGDTNRKATGWTLCYVHNHTGKQRWFHFNGDYAVLNTPGWHNTSGTNLMYSTGQEGYYTNESATISGVGYWFDLKGYSHQQ